MTWRAASGRPLRKAETEILRDVALRARWGGDKRGAAMRPRDDTTADKLMARRLLWEDSARVLHKCLTNYNSGQEGERRHWFPLIDGSYLCLCSPRCPPRCKLNSKPRFLSQTASSDVACIIWGGLTDGAGARHVNRRAVR